MVKAPSSHLLLSPSPACLLRAAMQGSPRCPAAEMELPSLLLLPSLPTSCSSDPQSVGTLTNCDGGGSFYPPATDKPKKVGHWGSEVFGG